MNVSQYQRTGNYINHRHIRSLTAVFYPLFYPYLPAVRAFCAGWQNGCSKIIVPFAVIIFSLNIQGILYGYYAAFCTVANCLWPFSLLPYFDPLKVMTEKRTGLFFSFFVASLIGIVIVYFLTFDIVRTCRWGWVLSSIICWAIKWSDPDNITILSGIESDNYGFIGLTWIVTPFLGIGISMTACLIVSVIAYLLHFPNLTVYEEITDNNEAGQSSR